MFDVASDAAIRDVWSWSLSWFIKPPQSPAKRAKQAALVEGIKGCLADCATPGALHARYAAGTHFALAVARSMHPRDWTALGIHACTAAAFGLRYVELMTGKTIDARLPLPRWASEWATW
jgi:hypothetical protein